MKRPLLLLALLPLLFLGGRYAYQTFAVSEEAKIGRQLDALAKEFSKDKDETIIVAMQSGARVLKYFAEEFIADPGSPFPKVDDKKEFIGLIANFRNTTNSLKVSDVDRDIRTRGHMADVVTTLRADYNGLGQRGTEIRTFQIGMEKFSGEWLITRVDLLEE